MEKRKTSVERFEEKYFPEPNTGCWLWTGAINGSGYGQLFMNGRLMQAHEFSYSMKNGPVADGLELDHLCRTRLCVNPDHVEPVSHHENMLRRAATVTHCKYGHPYVEGSFFLKKRKNRPGIARRCKQCHNRMEREKRARDRLAAAQPQAQEANPRAD